MLYGLIAALGWGLSAVAATNAARRTGTYLSVLSGQALGVVVLVVLTAVIQPSFAVGGSVLAFLVVIGIISQTTASNHHLQLGLAATGATTSASAWST